MHRRNEYDVTNSVNTTDLQEVSRAICDIYRQLYQRDVIHNLPQAFDDLRRLYRGEYPGYHACDTEYHNVQHVLDVALAMARLMDGCVRATGTAVIDERLFRFGVITALYHDCGYIRHRKDTRHHNGAEYTLTHVSRGARFLQEYMTRIGMADMAQAAARTIHFTGYEVPLDRIRVDPEFRLIGNLLGSADLLAQMADRCYLEKCYDRLYPELVRGGVARRRKEDGREEIVYSSAADLVFKTPRFYQGATRRMFEDLGGHAGHVEKHFGGQNPYYEELEKNIAHARNIVDAADIGMLRRKPPAADGEEQQEPAQPRLL